MPHDSGVPTSGGGTGGAAVGAGGGAAVGAGGTGVGGVGAGGSSGQMTSPHPSGSVVQVSSSALGPEHDALHRSMMKLHRTHVVELGMLKAWETMVLGGHDGSGVGMFWAETGTTVTMVSAVRANNTKDEWINFILQTK